MVVDDGFPGRAGQPVAMTKFLVTGATGNVGRQVVAQLLPNDVRALTRNPATADLPGVDVRQGGIEDIETALAGVDAVFLMWPFHSTDPATAVVDAIGRHARRVVFLSSGAVVEPGNVVGVWHAAVERAVTSSGLEWTIIRPSAFAANTLWWANQIRTGDEVHGVHGSIAAPLLHEADIAAVAVQALTHNGHDRRTHTLTGPETLSQVDQVRIIGDVLDRPLRWVEETPAEARARLLADSTFPDSFVEPLLTGYHEMLTKPSTPVTSTVMDVTGQPARTFRQWVADHRAEFTR
ncbi:NAD(P)H-binding protein [Kibdelosporangium lantanae]